ncbi:Hypothetical protein HVR_LOCUS305 [uncultured virus]|nr:Hypothetical protein HVR_LOCUS305 [uncultured virus]
MMNLCDIIALQEVTMDTIIKFNDKDYYHPGELKYYQQCLDSEFVGNFYPHDVSYSNEWKFYSLDSPYSYIETGNALFFRRSSFTNPLWKDLDLEIDASIYSDRKLFPIGNHAIYGEAIHLISGRPIRIINPHLSSESPQVRILEFQQVLNQLPFNSQSLDIIVGDFNNGLDIPPFQEIINQHKFRDALSGIDDKLTYSMYDRPRKRFPVDHIIFRGDNINVESNNSHENHGFPEFTITGVIDSRLWTKYPYNGVISSHNGITNAHDKIIDVHQKTRLQECLDIYGSDHIPIIATLNIR